MVNAVAKTLNRLMTKIHLPGFDNVLLLLEGLSIEFDRVITLKKRVLKSVIPNENMDIDSIDDYNEMYNIPSYLSGTNAEKINRIIERASLTGDGSVAWLQEQIQKAGFPLYVIQNVPRATDEIQYGDIQYSESIQYGRTTNFFNPALFPGELIVGTHPSEGEYSITTNAQNWGFFSVLSPFPDRMATLENELLVLTQSEFNYLFRVVVSIKHMRNWCIAQVRIVN